MALFGHKKKTESVQPTPAPQKTVNADDFWNDTPRKKNTVIIKESKYDEPTPEEIGADSIDPETIRKKMEQLEEELKVRDSKPVQTYSDFDVNPIKDDEVSVAQDRFEQAYEIEHQKYLDSHVQDISSANADDLDRKLTEMLDEHDKRAKEVEDAHYDIEQVDNDEVQKGLAELHDPKDVTKDKDYKNIEAVSDEAMSGAEEYIRTQLDTREQIEDEDEIESVSAEDVEKKTQEFMEKYGDRTK